jgi:hypothetical protein
VHHTRKAQAEDPYDTVSGTLGLTGAADSVLILYRDPTCGAFSLLGKGRDLQDYEHGVRFDPKTCRWSKFANADEMIASASRKKILQVLKGSEEEFRRKDIIDQTGLTTDTVKKQLKRLMTDGKVVKTARGEYTLVTVDIDTRPDASEDEGPQPDNSSDGTEALEEEPLGEPDVQNQGVAFPEEDFLQGGHVFNSELALCGVKAVAVKASAAVREPPHRAQTHTT